MSSDRPVRRREIEDSTAARLAEIVAAAEQAAKRVIDEAEEEARTRLDDAAEEADRIVTERLAGLAELTDEVSAQAAELARRAEELQRALARAKAELGGIEPPAAPATMRRRDEATTGDAEPRGPLGPSLTVVGGVVDEEVVPEIDFEPVAESASAKSGRERVAPSEDPTPIGTPAGARLLATQMAVSGASRGEIESRLRDGFAIEDTRGILDAILGPEA